MQKLLLIWVFVLVSCKSKNSLVLKAPHVETIRIDTLKVDQNNFSSQEKEYLNIIDSISTIIDSQNKSVHTKKAKVVQNNLETEVQYEGYSEQEGGAIKKVISSGINSKQKLMYTFDYLNDAVEKVVSEISDKAPFYSTIYFNGDIIYKPKELSLNSAQAAKAYSVLVLNYFKWK